MNAEKSEKELIFKVYKDILHAVTQGKFVLADQNEIDDYLGDGTLLAEQTVERPEDVARCRKLVEKYLNNYSFDPKEIRKTVLAISEGTTNILKHAEGGKLTIEFCGCCLKMV